jgi:hypothetical protein
MVYVPWVGMLVLVALGIHLSIEDTKLERQRPRIKNTKVSKPVT